MKIAVECLGDISCPWCYVSERRIMTALSLVNSGAVDFQMTWVPFIWDAAVPKEGVPKLEYFTKKLGAQRLAENLPKTSKAYEDEGAHYSLDGLTGCNRDCHRLLLWVLDEFGACKQIALLNEIWRLYHGKALFVGSCPEGHVNLAAAAAAVGIPRQSAMEVLSDPEAYRAQLDRVLAGHKEAGVNSIPRVVIGGRLKISGTKTVGDYVAAMQQVAMEMRAEAALAAAAAGQGGVAAAAACRHGSPQTSNACSPQSPERNMGSRATTAGTAAAAATIALRRAGTFEEDTHDKHSTPYGADGINSAPLSVDRPAAQRLQLQLNQEPQSSGSSPSASIHYRAAQEGPVAVTTGVGDRAETLQLLHAQLGLLGGGGGGGGGSGGGGSSNGGMLRATSTSPARLAVMGGKSGASGGPRVRMAVGDGMDKEGSRVAAALQRNRSMKPPGGLTDCGTDGAVGGSGGGGGGGSKSARYLTAPGLQQLPAQQQTTRLLPSSAIQSEAGEGGKLSSGGGASVIGRRDRVSAGGTPAPIATLDGSWAGDVAAGPNSSGGESPVGCRECSRSASREPGRASSTSRIRLPRDNSRGLHASSSGQAMHYATGDWDVQPLQPPQPPLQPQPQPQHLSVLRAPPQAPSPLSRNASSSAFTLAAAPAAAAAATPAAPQQPPPRSPHAPAQQPQPPAAPRLPLLHPPPPQEAPHPDASTVSVSPGGNGGDASMKAVAAGSSPGASAPRAASTSSPFRICRGSEVVEPVRTVVEGPSGPCSSNGSSSAQAVPQGRRPQGKVAGADTSPRDRKRGLVLPPLLARWFG